MAWFFRRTSRGTLAIKTRSGTSRSRNRLKKGRTGIDPSFYGQIERGANTPSLRTLFAVAEVLRVEPSELLPKMRGRRAADPLLAEALGSLLSRLKPGKRRFLMGVVRDLADELER